MIVPVTETNLHVISHNETADAFREIIAGNLPGFVLHEAGYIYDDALDLVDTSLPGTKVNLPFTKVHHDIGQGNWHTDGSMKPDGPIVTTVNLHYTTGGEALCSFLEPTPTNPDLGYITPETVLDLRHGVIDDELFAPQCLRTITRARTLIAFRSGGHLPLAHQFLTHVAPRSSEVGFIKLNNPSSL